MIFGGAALSINISEIVPVSHPLILMQLLKCNSILEGKLMPISSSLKI